MPEAQDIAQTYVSAATPFAPRVVSRPSTPTEGHRWTRVPGVVTTEVSDDGYVFVGSLQPISGGGSSRAIDYEPGVYRVGSASVASVPTTSAPTHADPVAPAFSSAAETVASQRVRLLARKYENRTSPEDVARLEILTERLNRLAPRTTEFDIAQLEQTAQAVNEIQARIDLLSAEYGV